MTGPRRDASGSVARPGRVRRRLVVHGALGAIVAASLAAFSSLVLVRWEDEGAPEAMVRLRAPVRGPAPEPSTVRPLADAPPAARRGASLAHPPIVHVSRLTRGGPQVEAAAVEPLAAALELDALRALEREVYAAADARARLELVDAFALETSPARMIPLLERLLDRPAGRTGDDVRALRIGVLARLGRYRDDLRAERRLLEAARDDRGPRLERLAAIDALRCGGALHESSRATLERVARDDPDLQVRQRARWALGQG